LVRRTNRAAARDELAARLAPRSGRGQGARARGPRHADRRRGRPRVDGRADRGAGDPGVWSAARRGRARSRALGEGAWPAQDAAGVASKRSSVLESTSSRTASSDSPSGGVTSRRGISAAYEAGRSRAPVALNEATTTSPSLSPSRSTDCAVTSAVIGPIRTRTRFPSWTREAIGARTWLTAESSGASRATETSQGYTTTETGPRLSSTVYAVKPESSATAVRPAGPSLAMPRRRLAPVKLETKASAGEATSSEGGAVCSTCPSTSTQPGPESA